MAVFVFDEAVGFLLVRRAFRRLDAESGSLGLEERRWLAVNR